MNNLKEVNEQIEANKEILNTFPRNNAKNIKACLTQIQEYKQTFTDAQSKLLEEMKKRIEKLEEIKNMPKVVLHLHLDGSLRPETVYNWLKQGENNVTLEEVKEKLMVDKDCRDLNQYLQKFDLPLKVLQTEDHIEQATYELFEDLAKQNVIYAEVRFAPSLHTQEGLSYERVVESAIKGMNRAKKEFKIEGNLLLCCMRGEDNTLSNLTTVATCLLYTSPSPRD